MCRERTFSEDEEVFNSPVALNAGLRWERGELSSSPSGKKRESELLFLKRQKPFLMASSSSSLLTSLSLASAAALSSSDFVKSVQTSLLRGVVFWGG